MSVECLRKNIMWTTCHEWTKTALWLERGKKHIWQDHGIIVLDPSWPCNTGGLTNDMWKSIKLSPMPLFSEEFHSSVDCGGFRYREIALKYILWHQVVSNMIEDLSACFEFQSLLGTQWKLWPLDHGITMINKKRGSNVRIHALPTNF